MKRTVPGSFRVLHLLLLGVLLCTVAAPEETAGNSLRDQQWIL